MFEFPQQVEQRVWGIAGPEATAAARRTALEYGTKVAGLCGNIWPARDDGLYSIVAQQVISEVVPFAIHARRYMELTGNKKGAATSYGPLVGIKVGAPYEMDVWTALNRIVHASDLRIEFVTPKSRKHDHLGDLVIASLIAISPERAEVRVCPQGIFYGLMEKLLPDNRPAPKAKQRN